MDIIERLEKLKKTFKNEQFLTNKGLSNEVGIYIFAYNPKDEMIVRNFISREAKNKTKYNIKEYNLYDLFLNICDDKRITKGIPSLEKTRGTEFVKEQLIKIVTPDALIKKMAYTPHKYGDIVLIDGVGEVYPIVRVHSLLESIRDEFRDVPLVVMYPGAYNSKILRPFDKFDGDNHYRSFNLI